MANRPPMSNGDHVYLYQDASEFIADAVDVRLANQLVVGSFMSCATSPACSTGVKPRTGVRVDGLGGIMHKAEFVTP